MGVIVVSDMVKRQNTKNKKKRFLSGDLLDDDVINTLMTSFSLKMSIAIVSGMIKNIPLPNFNSIGELWIFYFSDGDPLDDDVNKVLKAAR